MIRFTSEAAEQASRRARQKLTTTIRRELLAEIIAGSPAVGEFPHD